MFIFKNINVLMLNATDAKKEKIVYQISSFQKSLCWDKY